MKRLLKNLFEYLVTVVVLTGLYLVIIYSNFRDISILQSIKSAILVIAPVSLFMLVVFRVLIKKLGDMRYLRSPLAKIDEMTGEEFEFVLSKHFERQGYAVEMTPASNDYGADLILQKKDETIVVQAKRYEGKVGTTAVQEVTAAKDYYEADRCIVVTNSYFTRNAVNLAEANEVELIDRDELAKLITGRNLLAEYRTEVKMLQTSESVLSEEQSAKELVDHKPQEKLDQAE